MTDRAFTPEELEAVRTWRKGGGYLIGVLGDAGLAGEAIDALLARNPPPKPKMRPTAEAVAEYSAERGFLDTFAAKRDLQAAADAGLLADEWLEPVDG